MTAPLLLRDCVLPDGRSADVLLQEGYISAVDSPNVIPQAVREIKASGRLLTPGLADMHLHPDKAFGLDEASGSAGSLAEAIAQVRARKPFETSDAVRERTLRLLRWCLSLGTTRVRLHAEVDPLLQLRSVEGVLAAREAMRGLMRIEVVAFPQEGIVCEPGTLDLMRKAMTLGCDVVGAISYQDPDAREHLSLAAALARETGKPLDVHADFGIAPGASALAVLADVVSEYGLQGRVMAGHCTTLAKMDAPRRHETICRLRDAGVAVIALPRTDLYLDGVIAPLEELSAGGVSCCIATNNVRNAFTPVGRPSLTSAAAVYCLAQRIGDKAALTRRAESLWGGTAIVTGAPADFCLWPVAEPWLLVSAEAEPDSVIVGGDVVFTRTVP